MKDSSFVEVRAEQTPDNAEWFQARPTPCGDAAPVGLAAHPCADSPATSLNDGPEGIRHRAHGFPKSITVATTAVGRESARVRHHAHPGGASRNSRNPRKKPFWTACPADGRFLARWASMSSASTPWKTADHPCLLHRFRPRDHPAALKEEPVRASATYWEDIGTIRSFYEANHAHQARAGGGTLRSRPPHLHQRASCRQPPERLPGDGQPDLRRLPSTARASSARSSASAAIGNGTIRDSIVMGATSTTPQPAAGHAAPGHRPRRDDPRAIIDKGAHRGGRSC